MRDAKRRWASVIAAALALSSTACGGNTDEQPVTAGKYDGAPVTIEFWGSKPNLKVLAEEFTKQGTPITVKFVEQAGAVELTKNLRNAFTSGGGPCVFDTATEDLNSLASDGIAADLTGALKPSQTDYSPAAWNAVQSGGKMYGVPASSIPNFMLYNAPAFQRAGLPYPKTWEEFIEAGKKLKSQGVKIYNLAGEDYTTYLYLAWQAGAQWWQLKGDGWKVAVDSAPTAKSAEVLQQLIDNDLVEKISYNEFAAMMQDYNGGKIASRQLSTWQTQSMQNKLTTGLGQWEPAPNPTFAGEAPANVSFTRVYAVNSKCANKDAAAYFAHWISTNPSAVGLAADGSKGVAWFPAVANPKPYIKATQPTALLGRYADAWQSVVENAVTTQKGDWTYGPDAASAFKVLADLWGKAVARQIRVADIAPQLQQWIVSDLKQSGITVVP
ncbi:ABC transporter substrate-binding protein [Amycolatopsis sp. CA-126428]|uniref:ABC transporter substrate-binding protein n=1 Tax=Amycolatopsis sp. CA-126428 TaxID=2073158 RepID=UPI000CD0C1E5|nr:extracellular solute-binding protein [Amycolatopsis sp. CA-126428]